MEKVIIVSADGHAGMPPARWSEYLDERYHDFLPAFHEETTVFSGSMSLLNDLRLSPDKYDIFDKEGLYQSGRWQGLWDPEVRLEEMDREGVAAEFVYPGDFRAIDLGYNTMNGTYPFEVVDAGVRAFDRWLVDTFGDAKDRFLLVGPSGTYSDMGEALAEAEWVADHGFTGTFAPGFTHFPGMRPLDDMFWEPLWSLYEERGLALVVHGGYGFDQGVAFAAVEAANAKVAAQGGGVIELATALSDSFFNPEFFSDLRCRRALWQMLLGGVFDRHPNLKLMMVEVRADWVPATLRRLDAAYAEHRDAVPANRPPSEYWATNCMAGVSFMHKSEVEMRDEIGLETIDFGRDYPHTEGTWPNTAEYLRGLFGGVPEDDVRLILGENVIRFLGLDRAPLAAIAERIGPTIEEITGTSTMDPDLLVHLDDRCGYLKPAEGDSRIPEIEGLLNEDLSGLQLLGAQ
jgi:predicted TIM-barrel fold metal-dependent hydrolase